jgi:hypothetical protein
MASLCDALDLAEVIGSYDVVGDFDVVVALSHGRAP